MPVRVGSRPVAFRNPVTSPSNVESWSNRMKRCGPSPGNTSAQLLPHPRGRWLAGHVEVQNRASMVFDDEGAREQLEGQRGTVKKWQATIASRWLARNAAQ